MSCSTKTSLGRGRRYRQSTSPVTAFNAITWLFGVDTNITPPLTIGAASCTLGSSVGTVHTCLRRVTLSLLISASGLNPHPSYVRRIISQFCSSGLSSRSAVTGR